MKNLRLGKQGFRISVIIILSFALGLVACSTKKKAEAEKGPSTAKITPPTPPPASTPSPSISPSPVAPEQNTETVPPVVDIRTPNPKLGCPNPFPYEIAPAGSKPIEAKSLIDGKRGRYMLSFVRMHAFVELEDGTRPSVTTQTFIQDPTEGDLTLQPKVICQDLKSSEELNSSVNPPDQISTEDGRYDSRWNVMYDFTTGGNSKGTAESETVNEPHRFGEDAEHTAELARKLADQKISYGSKIYKISDTEFEMRMYVSAPNSKSKRNVRMHYTYAMRYVLDR